VLWRARQLDPARDGPEKGCEADRRGGERRGTRLAGERPETGPRGGAATSAGVSDGVDLALHLVARLVGGEHAAATARQMDYPWADLAASPA
jgi:hypothetical protein